MSCLTMPITVGTLHLKNRLVMPAMATFKAETDGRVTPSLLQYYDEKTRGGYLGMVITEHCFVSADGKASPNQLSAADDTVVCDLRRLCDIIHRNSTPVILQLNHAGSATTQSAIGTQPVGPSAVINPSKRELEMPRELTREEIQKIVQDFAAAAARGKQAGFDGVEIHSCHGYLLNQFLSPLTNKRIDEYGGKIEGRVRIHLEVIQAVRNVVGVDYPIFLRLGATDFMEGGLSLEDSITAACIFERAGINMLDISGGMCRYTLPSVDSPGYFSEWSQAVKKAVSIPVMVAGGVKHACDAEMLLQRDCADIIGVGRAILQDSGWALKAMTSVL
ncbi:NADH:flavin oxidoreductase [Oscillospiraceae bacterium MB24-C1]|nr:NADH:flavin oxidoreductase [Oscillospiraceae bacterium MB24-C1]